MEALTRKKFARALLILLCVLAVCLAIAVIIGPSPISVSDLFSDDDALRSMAYKIIIDIRLSRALLACCVGAALATAGASFQAVLQNPLAEPYLLGVMGGGAVGAIIAMAFGINSHTFIIFASFAGTLCAMALVWSLAKSAHGGIKAHNLLLSGVIINATFSAIIMFITSVVPPEKVRDIVFWLMGGIYPAKFSTIGLLFIFVIVGCTFLFLRSAEFNLLAFGDEAAAQLGARVRQTKLVAFIFSGLITGAAVSFVGIIGFVGLIVPHMVRLVFGPDNRLLLPASALAGAALLVLCDSASTVVLAPAEVPAGAITAILGGPFFLWLLVRRHDKGFADAA